MLGVPVKLLSNIENALSLLLAPLPAKARQFSESPFYLLAFCLLINSLSSPYLGFQHDSLFYLAAALPDRLERIGAASHLLPAVQLLKLLIPILGAKLTFFIFYIGSKALLFSAFIALVQHFYRGSLSFLAVVSLCCLPWSYSGSGIFQLNESFFTPRLPAIALAIWSLVYFLRSNTYASLLAGSLCFALHPLYGFYCLGFYIFTMCLGKRELCGRSLALCATPILLCILSFYTFSDLPIFHLRENEHLQLTFLRSAFYLLPLFDIRDISLFAILLCLNISLIPLLPEHRQILLGSLLLFLCAILASTISFFLPLEFLFLAQPIRACFLSIPVCVILTYSTVSTVQNGLLLRKKLLLLALLTLAILGTSFSTLTFILTLIWLGVLSFTGRPLLLVVTLCISLGLGYFNAHFSGTNIGRKQRIQAAGLLTTHIPPGAMVYWPGMLEEIWIELAADSFFSFDQMAPVIFSKKVADILNPRIALVAPFELAYASQAEQGRYAGRFLQKQPGVTLLNQLLSEGDQNRETLQEALNTLCQSRELDFVILPERLSIDMKEVGPNLFILQCHQGSAHR